MNTKTYSLVTGVIFLIIAVMHALRIVYGWEAMIGGWAVPIWFSWIGVLLAGFLSYTGITSSRKSLM